MESIGRKSMATLYGKYIRIRLKFLI